MKPLKEMTIDELLELRTKVEASIVARAEDERRRLNQSLQKLDAIVVQAPHGTNGHSKANGNTKRRTLAPKYRNPANPRQTWAGRGLRPRWLVAALKGGRRKLSDFEIKRSH